MDFQLSNYFIYWGMDYKDGYKIIIKENVSL